MTLNISTIISIVIISLSFCCFLTGIFTGFYCWFFICTNNGDICCHKVYLRLMSIRVPKKAIIVPNITWVIPLRKKHKSYNNVKYDRCSICLEPLKKYKICVLPCKHLYHESCIEQWSMRNGTCPQCRVIFIQRV